MKSLQRICVCLAILGLLSACFPPADLNEKLLEARLESMISSNGIERLKLGRRLPDKYRSDNFIGAPRNIAQVSRPVDNYFGPYSVDEPLALYDDDGIIEGFSFYLFVDPILVKNPRSNTLSSLTNQLSIDKTSSESDEDFEDEYDEDEAEDLRLEEIKFEALDVAASILHDVLANKGFEWKFGDNGIDVFLGRDAQVLVRHGEYICVIMLPAEPRITRAMLNRIDLNENLLIKSRNIQLGYDKFHGNHFMIVESVDAPDDIECVEEVACDVSDIDIQVIEDDEALRVVSSMPK